MKIYITNVERSDHKEFMDKALPIITEERRERIRNYKSDSNKVTSAAAELLLWFAVEDQVMSDRPACADNGERGVKLRPVSWRKLTAGFLGHEYTFTWSDKGKPVFAEPGAPYFSITHTDNIAAVVISDAPVGIDIEGETDVKPLVVRKAFTPSDSGWILSAEDDETRESRFLRCWTLKESYVKMLGESVFSGAGPVLFKDGGLSDELLKECVVVEERYGRYYVAAVRKK